METIGTVCMITLTVQAASMSPTKHEAGLLHGFGECT